jgi:hypothetical protein
MTQSDAKSFSKLLKEDKEEVACHCNGLECPPDTARVNSEFLKPGKKQTTTYKLSDCSVVKKNILKVKINLNNSFHWNVGHST